MHHAGNTNGADFSQFQPIVSPHISSQVGKALPEARHRVFQMVRPQAVFQSVLPTVGTVCQKLMGGVADQHRFNPRGAKLDAQCRVSCPNGLDRVLMIHAITPFIIRF